jgi:hypothetical protein
MNHGGGSFGGLVGPVDFVVDVRIDTTPFSLQHQRAPSESRPGRGERHRVERPEAPA